MKLNEIPEEYQGKVDFACKVCRNKFKTCTGRNTNCAWRGVIGEVCDFMEEAIQQTEKEVTENEEKLL